jgi:hypothetical protein
LESPLASVLDSLPASVLELVRLVSTLAWRSRLVWESVSALQLAWMLASTWKLELVAAAVELG